MVFKKVNLIAVLITTIVSSSITYYICSIKHQEDSRLLSGQLVSVIPTNTNDCEYNISRLNGYKFIRPLMFEKPICESRRYQGMKTEIENKIAEFKKDTQLISASVFIRDFEKSEWASINDTETYLPGSLIKVFGLITYLKMDEEHPGVLDKKLTFNSPAEFIPDQTFNSKHVQLGNTYSVRELLKYMISFSDNNATYLLNKNVDLPLFKKVFADLGIPPPNFEKNEFRITARDFSTLMVVIYNAGYLTIEHSEIAAELLEQCDFNEGFKKGIPSTMHIAHKFGEMGDANTRQLHESGIFYFDKKPYLLTVLTKGYDVKRIPNVLATISKIVYDSMSKSPMANK